MWNTYKEFSPNLSNHTNFTLSPLRTRGMLLDNGGPDINTVVAKNLDTIHTSTGCHNICHHTQTVYVNLALSCICHHTQTVYVNLALSYVYVTILKQYMSPYSKYVSSHCHIIYVTILKLLVVTVYVTNLKLLHFIQIINCKT